MSIPRLCLHRASKRFFIWVDGKRVYFKGRGDNLAKPPVEVLAQYRDALRHVLNDEPAKPDLIPETMTMVELADQFIQWAATEYQTSQQSEVFRYTLRPVIELAGLVPVEQFGPRKLIEVQAELVKTGRTRQGINKILIIVRQMFRWAVEREYVQPSALHGLQAVRPLRKGRTGAPESRRLDAVPDEVIQATIPHLPVVIADMIMVQRHTGMRPGEVCDMTMAEIDRTADVWLYKPGQHKNAWREMERKIYIGPKAQEIISKYFRADGKPLFSPADWMLERRELRRSKRKSKVQPSQVDRRTENPLVAPGDRYTKDSYTRAIARACKKHGIPHWSPNQVRKTKAVEVLEQLGLDFARAIVGHHDDETTTRYYAKEDKARCMQVARAMG